MPVLSNKKIFITGASGFIGKNLVDTFANKKNIEVHCLVRSKADADLVKKKGTFPHEGDIRDFTRLSKFVERADIVFNLASGLPHHHLPDKEYWETNVIGVENLMKACALAKVKRVVHVSTVGIYGKAAEQVDENSKTKPTDAYTKSKLAGEKVIRKYSKKGLATVIIRPTIAYGPYDSRPGFYDLFKLIEKGMFVPIGDGSNYFHTIYVQNLVDALILAGVHKNAVGDNFIIGDDPCPTMKEIWNGMHQVVGKQTVPFSIPKGLAYFAGSVFDILKPLGIPSLLSTRRVNFLTEGKRYTIQKAKKVLGYQPKVSLEEGLYTTYLWYKKNGHLK